MASIEQRGGGFRVRWRSVAGQPRSRQCPDRKTARQVKAEVERAAALGRDWPEPPEDSHGPGLDDLAAAYLIDCRRRLKASTVERKTAILGLMLEGLTVAGVLPGPDALTRENLHRWHAALVSRVSRSTAAAYLYEAGQLWKWAADSDEWAALVSRPRTLDPGPVPAPARITGPSIAAIDAAIAFAESSPRTQWHARLLVFMRFTGLRAGQVRRLAWSDVDVEGLRLTVRPELGKSRQEQRGRSVPLHPGLAAELATWGERSGLVLGPERARPHNRTLARIWSSTGESPRQPLHGIRHTFVSTLAAAGVPELVIGVLVGHAGLVTREVYIDPAALWGQMVDAVARIPPLRARGVSGAAGNERKPAQE